MKLAVGDPSRGILDYQQALSHFTVNRYDPPPTLGEWVENYWSVAWNLPNGEEYIQNNLSHASINIVVETDGVWFYGVPDRLFVRRLSGTGQALGIKFRPGGFYPFVRTDLSRWTGKRVDIETILGPKVAAWKSRLMVTQDIPERQDLCNQFLAWLQPGPVARSTGLVARLITTDPSDHIKDIAGMFSMDERTLQRLVRQEVGIGPKEILKRFRLQAAAERLLREPELHCGDLAATLGYTDQAHFTRDFKAVVGRSPGQYQVAQQTQTHQ